MTRAFLGIQPTIAERSAALAGDSVVRPADVVMDRAMTLPASPEAVWPWLVQLGKGRGGWYLPYALERALPHRHRAVRFIDHRWQGLQVGDVIPDYGGADATFEVLELRAPHHIVFGSRRGRINVSWAIVLTPAADGSRVQFRLRLGGVKRIWLARSVGDLFDRLTIAGLAGGLRERLLEARPGG